MERIGSSHLDKERVVKLPIQSFVTQLPLITFFSLHRPGEFIQFIIFTIYYKNDILFFSTFHLSHDQLQGRHLRGAVGPFCHGPLDNRKKRMKKRKKRKKKKERKKGTMNNVNINTYKVMLFPNFSIFRWH